MRNLNSTETQHPDLSERPAVTIPGACNEWRSKYFALALSVVQGCHGEAFLCIGAEEPQGATVYCHAPSTDLDGHPRYRNEAEDSAWWASEREPWEVTTGWDEVCPSTSNQAALEGIGWTCIQKENGEFDFSSISELIAASQCDNERFLCP